MTREEIWEALPNGVRRNEVRFKRVLEAENGKLWVKSGNGGKGTPYRYRRIEMVTHSGEEQGGEE